MRKSDYRIRADVGRIHTDSYAEICRNGKPNSFTRSRKMPYDDLTYSMINRKGLTLSMELRGFMNITHPGEQISKPGYLKQRMKLNPDVFVDLYKFHIRSALDQFGTPTPGVPVFFHKKRTASSAVLHADPKSKSAANASEFDTS